MQIKPLSFKQNDCISNKYTKIYKDTSASRDIILYADTLVLP